MAISNLQFNSLLCSMDYHNHLIGVVINEAHFVQWGSEFGLCMPSPTSSGPSYLHTYPSISQQPPWLQMHCLKYSSYFISAHHHFFISISETIERIYTKRFKSSAMLRTFLHWIFCFAESIVLMKWSVPWFSSIKWRMLSSDGNVCTNYYPLTSSNMLVFFISRDLKAWKQPS